MDSCSVCAFDYSKWLRANLHVLFCLAENEGEYSSVSVLPMLLAIQKEWRTETCLFWALESKIADWDILKPVTLSTRRLVRSLRYRIGGLTLERDFL